MGIKDVIDTVKKPTTLFFDGDYYNSVDELLAACNISRADYTQVKATHRDWDAMNVVDFLVKSNKGVLPSKNPAYKAKAAADAASNEPVINVLDTPSEDTQEAAVEPDADEEEYVPVTDEEVEVEETAEEATEEAAEDNEDSEEATDEANEDSNVEETNEEVESVEETAKEETKEEEPTMNEYDYTQGDAKAASVATPAPSGSTVKAFDELLANLNIAKEGYLVVKQVQADMSDLDIVNAILTTKGNPVGETSKDFDELLSNLNTPKIGFQLVKQIHSDWSDLDVINAIIKSR